ncbi:MAG: hypothetical protein MR598_05205 [Erysipelotrichaceae bacterium]|nr:hypothetical protein [Erysipelotrichaceae bacterium]
MTYLTVGTSEILKKSFIPIQDSILNSSIKPSGGLWMTEFDVNLPTYNCWVDYILEHPYILFYKNKSKNPFHQPCSIITLKQNAKIFYLSTKEQYKYLLQNYQKERDKFSFEKLSNDYDGIYINLFSLSKDIKIEQMNLFSTFGVNTLILFHPNCIDYYYSGMIHIDPFDYECKLNSEFIYYNIEWEQEKKYIEPKTKQILIKTIEQSRKYNTY